VDRTEARLKNSGGIRLNTGKKVVEGKHQCWGRIAGTSEIKQRAILPIFVRAQFAKWGCNMLSVGNPGNL
jgi:hypothetical protein